MAYVHNSTIERKTRIVRTAFKSNGPKTKANKKANAQLKRKFEAQGITSCELGYTDCTRDNFLSWAHGRKRRHLKEGELETLVCLACIVCHQVIERLPEAQMTKIVKEIIRARNVTTR